MILSILLAAAVERVASRLRCPICRQLSILESPSGLAKDMRAVVRERLARGETDQQVIAYFVSKVRRVDSAGPAEAGREPAGLGRPAGAAAGRSGAPLGGVPPVDPAGRARR